MINGKLVYSGSFSSGAGTKIGYITELNMIKRRYLIKTMVLQNVTYPMLLSPW